VHGKNVTQRPADAFSADQGLFNVSYLGDRPEAMVAADTQGARR
jgi:hypothetical protein